MENNLGNKARFFAQYWWQKLFVINGNNEDTYNNWRTEDLDKGYMLLTPLSDITDEDAVKLGYGNPSHLRANLLHNIDELRGLGYAMPWMGLSVEKLIEYGWVKLKTLNK